jgi:hypothetical protein
MTTNPSDPLYGLIPIDVPRPIHFDIHPALPDPSLPDDQVVPMSDANNVVEDEENDH